MVQQHQQLLQQQQPLLSHSLEPDFGAPFLPGGSGGGGNDGGVVVQSPPSFVLPDTPITAQLSPRLSPVFAHHQISTAATISVSHANPGAAGFGALSLQSLSSSVTNRGGGGGGGGYHPAPVGGGHTSPLPRVTEEQMLTKADFIVAPGQ